MCANYDSEDGCLPLDCPCLCSASGGRGSLCPTSGRRGATSGPGAGNLPHGGEAAGAGNKALCRMREGLYSRGAASLLFEACKAEGQPPPEPGAYAEKRGKTGGGVTIKAL